MRIVCPTCERVLEEVPNDFPARPFCSTQCKLVDLSNWLNERYRSPAEGDEGDEGLN